MTNTAKALYNFFSGFGLPAYVEYNVPDSAVLPYITYQVVEPDWMDAATIFARVWYRDTSYVAINAKADQIKAAIGGGAMLPTDGGCLVLEKGTPFVQEQPMEGDDTLKVYYLNFTIYAYTT